MEENKEKLSVLIMSLSSLILLLTNHMYQVPVTGLFGSQRGALDGG